jgi:hypothetical protein
MDGNDELNPEEQQYQGKEILTTIQAPTVDALDDMLEGMRDYAEGEGLEEFTILEKGEDPDGGYRAVISAHNWNPVTWFRERMEGRYKKKREEEKEVYATVKPYIKKETDTIDVKKALGAGVGTKVLRKAGVPKAEIRGATVVKPKERESVSAGEAIRGFTEGAERGAERVEGGLAKGIGVGVGGVRTVEKTGEGAIGIAGGFTESILAEPEVDESIKLGDRIAYPVGTVTGYGVPQPGWRVIRYPYDGMGDTELAVGWLPSDVKDVGSLGAAYKTIEKLTGKPPTELFARLSQPEGQVEQTSEPESEQPLAPPRKKTKDLLAWKPGAQLSEPIVKNVTF